MPVPKGARYKAKRISKKKYVRLAYKNSKLVEKKVMKYKRKKGR